MDNTNNPKYIGTICDINFYESPTYGDKAPLIYRHLTTTKIEWRYSPFYNLPAIPECQKWIKSGKVQSIETQPEHVMNDNIETYFMTRIHVLEDGKFRDALGTFYVDKNILMFKEKGKTSAAKIGDGLEISVDNKALIRSIFLIASTMAA